jgi:universal stress protein A
MSSVQIILHPTDFSTCSEHAFHLACSLGRDQRARLIILHVLERPVIVYTGVAMAPPAPPPVVERQAARAQLDQIQAPFSGLAIERRFEEGDPATGILHVAEELKSDLIVMGTHGRTGLGRLLMGSVAEKVVRMAKCPVLTVKTPMPEEMPT